MADSSAGASAQREFDRRSAKDREQREANRGRSIRWTIGLTAATFVAVFAIGLLYNTHQASIVSMFTKTTPPATAEPPYSTSVILTFAGGFSFVTLLWCIKTFFGPKATTTAYAKGAAGERGTAAVLAPLVDQGWVMLHDRHIPKRRENIDHVAIGPTGVLVIDAKRWTGKVVVSADGLKRQGRDESKVLDQVLRQVAAVEAALANTAHDQVEVRPIVCIHVAEIDRPGSTKKHPNRPRGVQVVEPSRLVSALGTGPVVLGPETIASIVAILDKALVPA